MFYIFSYHKSCYGDPPSAKGKTFSGQNYGEVVDKIHIYVQWLLQHPKRGGPARAYFEGWVEAGRYVIPCKMDLELIVYNKEFCK